MNFLAAIVPTLREVRVPLLCGYVYLLTLWLGFGQHLPERSSLEQDSVAGLLAQAMDAIGRPGQAAAASVIAYLVGSMVSDVLRSLFSPRGKLGKPMMTDEEVSATASRMTESQLDEAQRTASEAMLRGELAMALGILSLVVSFRASNLSVLPVAGLGALLGLHSLLLHARTMRLLQGSG